MRKALRSGTSGLTATQEPILPLTEDTVVPKFEKRIEELPERPLELEPVASPQPEEECDVISLSDEVKLVELIKNKGPITSDEVLATLAKSQDVREWAKRLTANFEKPKKELSQETRSILAPPKTSSEAALLAQITQIMELSDDLTKKELLTRTQLNKLELLLSKAFDYQGGTALRTAFKFLLTPRAAYFPNGDMEDTDEPIPGNERRVTELREAAQLSTRLFAGRQTGNGGLSMRDIIKLHADVTMTKAWQILGTLGTTADAVYDQHGRWTTLIRNVEILIWHAERINFADFFTLQKLKTWLIDAKGPRLEDIPARLTSLRNMLFPRATMEVQDPESYESYGLEILDEISFQNWNLVHTKPDMVEKRVHAPQDQDPDLAMAVGVRPGKRPRTEKPTGSNSKLNPVLDQLVADILADQDKAFEDDISSYY